MRFRRLRSWMILQGHTFVDFGRTMGSISDSAASRMLKQERMPVHRYKALVAGYPELPLELIPRAEDARNKPSPVPTPVRDGSPICGPRENLREAVTG